MPSTHLYIISALYLFASITLFANAAIGFGGGTRIENIVLGLLVLIFSYESFSDARRRSKRKAQHDE